jgi:hypothetical protein
MQGQSGESQFQIRKDASAKSGYHATEHTRTCSPWRLRLTDDRAVESTSDLRTQGCRKAPIARQRS